MVDKAELKSEIENVVRNEIHSGEIVNVIVDRDRNFDGDPIINVKIVYDNKKKKLDVDETLGLKTLVRKKLYEIGEDAFPIFYYILKSEAGKLAAAG